ncbi:hypothetical protein PHYPSEUDO_014922 [Phytophthora pseudosyringae]|uniref:FLZ-type domain-containing protein n=1 Tax=Phytophthora pseudosyringae TaxID=221518 RepID=A0A8T1V4C9_9STRA|nr:hypothetical protein PHYPSEUDO_014922 [Phytophthora pseudosyringae]
MNHAARVVKNQPTTSRWEISKIKGNCAQEETASRPSLASRMIRLVFKGGRRPSEQRAKSWPGRPEPVPVPPPTTTVAIPNSLATSAPSPSMPTLRTKVLRIRKQAADDSYSDAHWRQRQTHCANCERLFFTSMSTLSSSAGRFCSLDCKTNFQYVTELQGVLDAQALALDEASASCGVSLASRGELEGCTSFCSEEVLRF